jgi:hypothetical protein
MTSFLTLLAWLLVSVWLAKSSEAACVGDSYATLPPLPSFPTVAYAGAVNAANTYVQSHWSEMAQIGNYRPQNTINAVQTLCPHTVSGLLDWHDPATWGGAV